MIVLCILLQAKSLLNKKKYTARTFQSNRIKGSFNYQKNSILNWSSYRKSSKAHDFANAAVSSTLTIGTSEPATPYYGWFDTNLKNKRQSLLRSSMKRNLACTKDPFEAHHNHIYCLGPKAYFRGVGVMTLLGLGIYFLWQILPTFVTPEWKHGGARR